MVSVNERGIYWRKVGSMECNTDDTPPYPSLNAMAVLVDSYASCYVTRRMVDALRKRYERATVEIALQHNELAEQVIVLYRRIEEMETELRKWTSQTGMGKRPNRKIHARLDEVISMHDAGVSKREIARRIGVSDGTIRRMIRDNDNACLAD